MPTRLPKGGKKRHAAIMSWCRDDIEFLIAALTKGAECATLPPPDDDHMSIHNPQRPLTLQLQLSAGDFSMLSYNRAAWAGFADQAADQRFEFDASTEPWGDRWREAQICFHGENSYAEALIARAYLSAIGAEWIPLWDTAESRPGESNGHVTVFIAPPGH